MLETDERYSLLPPVVNTVGLGLEALTIAIKQWKEIKGVEIGKDDMSICRWLGKS